MNENKLAKTQSEEKMLEALFEYASASHVDNIIDESLAEEDTPSFSPSPDFDRKMKKLFAQYNRKEKLKYIRQRTLSFLPKAAIFLLVLLGSLTVVVASVQAVRVKVFNFVMDIKGDYTNIKIEENNPDTLIKSSQDLPPDWKGYFPTYIPSGFKIIRTESDTVENTIFYEDSNGKTIRFTQFMNINTDLRVDTENASVENIIINDSKSLVVDKQGLVSISWKGEFLFYLTGEVDNSDIIAMAKSISKK